jgi:hypothetical protein
VQEVVYFPAADHPAGSKVQVCRGYNEVHLY